MSASYRRLPSIAQSPCHQGLPFDTFTFEGEGEKAIKCTVEDKEFILQLDTYAITRGPALSEAEKSRLVPQIARKGVYGMPPAVIEVMEVRSPDGRWFAGLNEHNVWLRSTTDGRRVPLTTDGIEDYEWRVSGAKWSPDSFKLAIKKVDYRNAPKALIVHYLKPRPEVEWVRHDASAQTELFIVDILSKRQVRVDEEQDPGEHLALLGWRPDGSEMLFRRMDRGRKKFDLMAADPATGSTRVVVTESRKTFVDSALSRGLTLLEDGKRFIWMSERDGWNHLYLYDLEGNLIRRLTEGSFPVAVPGRNRQWMVAVDEKAGWVYFTAHAEERLYDTHLYRVNLEGQGFTRLTEGTGQHAIRFAPSQQFFLDTHSTIDRPPTVELRRANGELLQTLSNANIDALKDLKWKPPEEFVVTAADGETDLYGVLYKPYDFDPNKKYPVIEIIYASRQTTVVPRTFTSTRRGREAQALAQLGFITFIVDGRGTPERGKAFQDVVYGNLGRHEIPDHVAALKQLAEERPYMDLGRVGVYGYSSGGYFALRALLLAPDVYHVGIAGAPAPDPPSSPIQFSRTAAGRAGFGVLPQLGLPEINKEAYEYASNLWLAGNLKGKLLLVIGTSDVLISEIMKVVDALIRAGKPYDLLVLPEQYHSFLSFPGTARTYFWDAMRRYFQEHLKPEG